MTEDEVVGWHHCFDGHEFEQAPGEGDGQGSQACCSLWLQRAGHDLGTEQQWYIYTPHLFPEKMRHAYAFKHWSSPRQVSTWTIFLNSRDRPQWSWDTDPVYTTTLIRQGLWSLLWPRSVCTFLDPNLFVCAFCSGFTLAIKDFHKQNLRMKHNKCINSYEAAWAKVGRVTDPNMLIHPILKYLIRGLSSLGSVALPTVSSAPQAQSGSLCKTIHFSCWLWG